jgi:two-component system response regulator BaeR
MLERLILVEDEPNVSLVFTELLEAAGFAVTACAAYPEAAMYLEVQPPAALVTDIVLPGGGSGLELAALAEKLGVPTLLVSGHPDHITREQLGGAVKFLAKPFAMTELEAALRDLLDPTRNRDRNAPLQSAPADPADRDGASRPPLSGGG